MPAHVFPNLIMVHTQFCLEFFKALLNCPAKSTQPNEYFYNQGIGKEPDFKEPEDHISAEMNFLSLLSRQTYDAMNENDHELVTYKLKVQFDFLDKHLMKWIHKVCHDLYGIGDFMLYQSLARLTAGFIEADYQFLTEITE